MGKSSKKSTLKVEAAPSVAPQSGKKGKREAEETIEKQVSLKKQKKNAGVAQAITKKKVEAKTQKKKKDEPSSSSDDASDSEDEDSSSDEEAPAQNKKPVVAKNGTVPAAKTVKADSGSDSSSDEDDEPAAKTKVAAAVKNGSSSGSDSSDGDISSDEDEDAKKATIVKKTSLPTPKKIEDSSRSSSDESVSEEEDKAEAKGDEKPVTGKTAKKEESSDSDTSEDEDTDVEMMDATTPQKIAKKQDLKSAKKAPQTPATPQVQSTGSKTLFVGNLSYQVEQDDVRNFFKAAGEVVDIRFSTDAEGNFKGYGHVEFATAEDAQKALELNGEDLMNRSVKLDLARERGANTPLSSNGNNSFQKGGRGQARTIFVKGFDQSLGQDEIKSSLEGHFDSCGEISRVAIPVDRETGAVKGYAYLDFNDGDSFKKALELDGSELNDCSLSVDEAKPRGEFNDGPGSGRGGGRSGGRSGGGRGGRRGGGGGRFGGGGRSGGGRFGGGGRSGGGRFGGGGRSGGGRFGGGGRGR